MTWELLPRYDLHNLLLIPEFNHSLICANNNTISAKQMTTDTNLRQFTGLCNNTSILPIYFLSCRSDGTFSVNNVPSGSYVVEVTHPTYEFEAIRVDINSKGKFRARRLNNVQTSSVQTVSYPLRFKARGKAAYFQQREQWRITDILMNPMVCVMY